MKIESDIGRRFEFVEQTRERYNKQRGKFYAEFGVFLPVWNQLKNFGKLRDLRILCKRHVVTVTRDNSRYTQIVFNVGYLTDFASVPKFIRGLIDNDNPIMLDAVLFHDRNCSTHQYSFKETNQLFFDMLIEAGYSHFKSHIAHFAVSSYKGRQYWRMNGVRRREWTLLTTELQEAR